MKLIYTIFCLLFISLPVMAEDNPGISEFRLSGGSTTITKQERSVDQILDDMHRSIDELRNKIDQLQGKTVTVVPTPPISDPFQGGKGLTVVPKKSDNPTTVYKDGQRYKDPAGGPDWTYDASRNTFYRYIPNTTTISNPPIYTAPTTYTVPSPQIYYDAPSVTPMYDYGGGGGMMNMGDGGASCPT